MSLCSLNIIQNKTIAILAIGENSILHAAKITEKLRNNGIIADLLIGDKLNKLLSRANKEKFQFAIFVGENEIKNNNYLIRNLDNGEQNNFTYNDIEIKNFL